MLDQLTGGSFLIWGLQKRLNIENLEIKENYGDNFETIANELKKIMNSLVDN